MYKIWLRTSPLKKSTAISHQPCKSRNILGWPKSSFKLSITSYIKTRTNFLANPYDPAIPLLGIHTEETRIERDTCTPVFTAARCPLADEWVRKLWCIYTMEYYSAIKKNAFKYMEFRKMIMITLYIRQQKRHRCEEQTFGLCGRGRGILPKDSKTSRKMPDRKSVV